jgi:hypothetical protein
VVYEGQNLCFCSNNMCNGQNVTSIRGYDDCSMHSCPNSSVCFDTYEGYKCICPPWDPACIESKY